MNWKIELRKEPNPFAARIIIAGEWDANPDKVKNLLEEICKKWPVDTKVNFIITCGGFINFKSPRLPQIGDNKNPNPKVVEILTIEAERQSNLILDNKLRDKFSRITEFLTLGVDEFNNLIQLVGLLNIRSNKYHWTGKSYPTSNEESSLTLVKNLKTHFYNSTLGNLLLLGCFDLNLFINRGRKTERETWRKTIRKEFQQLVVAEKPKIVLQHPHTTDSERNWSAAFGAAKNLLPSMEYFASAGQYYEIFGEERSNIEDVLRKTKCGNTIDFIVHILK